MSFKDIKGQDRPIEILKSYISNARLANGYLFTGPDGIGKKLVAKNLAKAINCEKGVLDSCDNCSSCLKIDNDQHPDVHIIDALSLLNVDNLSAKNDYGGSENIKISHIRKLQKDISLRPYEAKRKVFIIDNAHNLTPAASNALLKILEEPPGESLIIVITPKPSLLFKTIISRCRVLKFIPILRSSLREILKKDYSLGNDLAHFLAYFCEGRIGDALRLKDTDVFKEKNIIVDAFCLSNNLSAEAFSVQDREAMRNYLNILASWLRDIYLIKTGTPHSELINLDRKEELLRTMGRYSFADLDEIFSFISESLLYVGQNVNIKLLLSNMRVNLWEKLSQ